MLHLEAIDLFEHDDGIDSRIRVHDENQVEFKLHYAIDPNARRTRYQVAAYFFVPQTLGVDSHTYGREDFFADVLSYIRFRTPLQPLEALASNRDPDSALARVEAALHAGEKKPLSTALRMLACLVRASSRDVVRGLMTQAESLAQGTAEREVLVEDLRGAIETFVDAVEQIVSGLRRLRPRFMHAQKPAWLRELFEYTDECLSVYLEAHCTKLVVCLDDKATLKTVLRACRARVTGFIVSEQEHRRAAAYTTVVNSGRPDGAYVHRRGMLKKFMSSVLYLELAKERDGQRVAQFGAAVAAGAAMLVSTVLAIWSQQVYGVNTFPFVMALVIGYMLKDRIKDWLKAYFSTKATRWLYDYSVRIFDPMSDVTVGRCRETFSVMPRGRTPRSVWRCRHAESTSAIETENKREVVLRYVKDITLAGRRIDKRVARASDISDIVRLDVSRFLVRMDDAEQQVPIFDAHADTVRIAGLHKRYHINVVLELRSTRGVVQIERFRLVLDKNGIRQLDALTSGAPLASKAEAAPAGRLLTQRV